MNQSNPFGSPQGGAFQAPSNTMKSSVFQSLGQQNSSNQSQTGGFYQPPTFGQPSGNTIFGQTPAFGQSSTQPSLIPTVSQAPAFGQPSSGMCSSSFGSGATQTFGQTSGSNQNSVFGQAPRFGKQPLGFDQQTSGYGSSQMTSTSNSALGQPQPMGFGQSLFGQPSSTSVTTSVSGKAQNVTQSTGFGSSNFNFKPANKALFKPIFSASPEPANPQTTSMSSSLFGSKGSQTSSSIMSSSSSITTTTGFSLLPGAKSGPLGFSFSQPAAAPSISAHNNPLSTGNTSGPSNTLQFTFSQPAAPSSSSIQASTSQPTTPSSFSFSVQPTEPQATHLFGPFGDTKAKADINSDDKVTNLEETNKFARLSKGTKRKEDPAVSSTGSEKPIIAEDFPAEADLPRQPSKRSLMRTHGPLGGLFGRALSDLRRDGTNPVRREATKETQVRREATKETQLQSMMWEETQTEVHTQSNVVSPTPVIVQERSRDVPEKSEESGSGNVPDPKLETTPPVKSCVRRENSESLSGMSPTDCTTIQCRNVPAALNKKEIIEKHFGRFGKVRKVFCRPAKNLAIVHFDDHVSAAKAKKKGKVLQRHELLLLWQRKKQSPGDKGNRPAVGTGEAEGESQEDTESQEASSLLKRPSLRAPAVDSMTTFSRSSPVKRSSLAKSLQFDTEPQKESYTETQSSECLIPSSLLHLIGRVAETAEDKYRLLEQRDKILRQGRAKRTDLDMSRVFVGTCPDMCPEKERFMRETRKQLSIYEVLPDTEMVDHSAAIKEYSRSSADQEEPLPHDLRPLPVLSMTMDYLVTQIMDQGHDNYRDWYDFVWNRTRGIRKDITQQRLCCPHTVSLIEKCTRFHVHCAHHLCEEHMSSFDAKINNENMTKCLQSLKEMYQDLATRQIYCSRESEFRQYSVLLKLNDGDILREVQQFREEVRNSPEVKFAVQAFAAVNSNNFVRFFKLVKGASYLASCLLHRYFNQVRAKALKAFNLAHTVGPRSTAFPLDDLVRMLMFHNIGEAADFIQQYGLNVNDDVVELSRTYQEPDLPLSQKKSDVILAKKTVLIGEVVNGGPLPNHPQHSLVCSFDSQNKYRGEGPMAEATPGQITAAAAAAAAAKVEVKAPPIARLLTQVVPIKIPEIPSAFGLSSAVTDETKELSEPYRSSAHQADGPELSMPITQPQPVNAPSPPPKPQPVYSNEDMAGVLDCVIEEVVEAAVKEVAHAGASFATTALAESSVQAESLVSEVLGQMLEEMLSAEIELERQRVAEEKRKLVEIRRRQEHEVFLVQFSFSLCTGIVHEVLDEAIKEMAISEIQQAVNEKADRVAKCTEQVCVSLVEETLTADIILLVEDFIEAELQRMHKFFNRWRNVVAVRRQLKRQMRGFPAAPCCVDPRFKLKALAPSAPAQPSIADLTRGLVSLGNAGMLALSSTRLLKMRQGVIHQMRVHYFYQQLLDEAVWAPLNLPALVTENFSSPPDRIFWKAILLLPSDHDSVSNMEDRILSDWLQSKFSGDRELKLSDEQLDGTLKTLCVTDTLQEKEECIHRVYISIKASRGPLTEESLSKIEEYHELHGTGALITLLPAMSIVQPEQDVPLLSALLQLKQLQKASTWHCPLPLVILVPGQNDRDTQIIEKALMLNTLVEEGLISEYMFLFIPETTSDLQGSKQLNQVMNWLLARAPPPIPLSCQTLVQLVETSLSREFSPRVYAQRQERAAAFLPPLDPAPVIQLYNAVLAHVADKVSSKELSRLSWPPCEFCQAETRDFVPPLGWNSVKHLDWLHKAVLSLQLPQWKQLSAADSWSELCSSICRYAAQIPVSRRSQPLLMSRLENLLERVRLNCHCTQIPGSNLIASNWVDVDEDVCPAFSQIPWVDVLVICIDHKLKDWEVRGQPVCEDTITENGEILVYFVTESLNGFKPPDEWTHAVRETHREKQQERQGASAAACATPSSLSLKQRLFHSHLDSLEALTPPLDISHTPTAQELLVHKVLQSLENEKTESKRCMEQLQHWLEGDPVDHLSTPLFIPSSLLSTPTTIRHAPAAKTRDAALTQDPKPDDLSDTADWSKTPPVSLTWRLRELERQVLSSQEEELACRLKLHGMLNIVDD